MHKDKWALAWGVVAVHAGCDSQVRVTTIRTLNGEYHCPSNKLALILKQEESTSILGENGQASKPSIEILQLPSVTDELPNAELEST